MRARSSRPELSAEVFAAPTHPYTRGLLDCIPVPGKTTAGEPLGNIPGVVPRMPPGFVGCGFRDRCALTMPECAATVPLRKCRRRSFLSLPAAAGLEASGRGMTLAIEVRNVHREFRQSGGLVGASRPVRAVDGVTFSLAGRRCAGRGGRIRLRQVDACASHHGPVAADLGRGSGGRAQSGSTWTVASAPG